MSYGRDREAASEILVGGKRRIPRRVLEGRRDYRLSAAPLQEQRIDSRGEFSYDSVRTCEG